MLHLNYYANIGSCFYIPAFITGASYQQLVKDGNKNWELLPVGAVFSHPTKQECAGYYADVIIHKNSKYVIMLML